MPIPEQLRRGLGIFIPLFSALLFWGAISSITGIGEHENLKQTGLTLAGLTGLFNAWLSWMIFKHRIP
ncbi:MAG: hypothetical protein AABY22_12150 [Nanoarchaeota archaeon]